MTSQRSLQVDHIRRYVGLCWNQQHIIKCQTLFSELFTHFHLNSLHFFAPVFSIVSRYTKTVKGIPWKWNTLKQLLHTEPARCRSWLLIWLDYIYFTLLFDICQDAFAWNRIFSVKAVDLFAFLVWLGGFCRGNGEKILVFATCSVKKAMLVLAASNPVRWYCRHRYSRQAGLGQRWGWFGGEVIAGGG